MNNELRDRIAEIVDATDNASDDDGFALAMPKDLAQAIIDELGLRTQTRGIKHTDVDTRQTRVVTPWGPIEH